MASLIGSRGAPHARTTLLIIASLLVTGCASERAEIPGADNPHKEQLPLTDRQSYVVPDAWEFAISCVVLADINEEEAKERVDYRTAYAMQKEADLWREKAADILALTDDPHTGTNKQHLERQMERLAGALREEKLRASYSDEGNSRVRDEKVCNWARTASAYDIVRLLERILFME